MNNWMKFFFNQKNVKVKSIKSYKKRERYQSDIILLPNFVWDGFNNIFTMMNHFTKCGWVIPLNDNKAETILSA